MEDGLSGFEEYHAVGAQGRHAILGRRSVEMQAEVSHVFIKPKHGEAVIPVARCTAVADQGLVGDVSFGRAARQVLLIDFETLMEFGLQPGDVRENLTVSGVSLVGIRRLSVGEVLLEVTGDCAPCSTMEALQPGLQERIRGRRGVLARVVRGGQIQVGDQVSSSPDPAPQAAGGPLLNPAVSH